MEKDAELEEYAETLVASFFKVKERSAYEVASSFEVKKRNAYEVASSFEVKKRNAYGGDVDVDEDDPDDLIEAKYHFSRRAKEAQTELRKRMNKDNAQITNKILVELYVASSLLNKRYTLRLERIKFYTQKINDLSLENIDYGKWHSTALEMETECANRVSALELITDLKIEISDAEDKYESAKKALENPKNWKYAGLWTLVGGALGGLVIMGLSALTGNPIGVGIGLGVFVGTIAVGGAIAVAGTHSESQAKAVIEERRKQLQYLRERLNTSIESKAADIIKQEEKNARKALGIED